MCLAEEDAACGPALGGPGASPPRECGPVWDYKRVPAGVPGDARGIQADRRFPSNTPPEAAETLCTCRASRARRPQASALRLR
ncbi:hypothetical protein H8959_004847 [Pygathrix nigripes]